MKVAISGGGTGGHIYPALAVADEIRRRRPDAQISFIGSQDGMEAAIVPGAGYPFSGVRVSGISRASWWKAAKALVMVPEAIRQAESLLQDIKPDLVLGTGGYASFPVLTAAVRQKRKTFIHEQNAFPGLSNRRLASRVDCVFLTFPEALQYMKPRKYKVTGFPVRREIGCVDASTARNTLNLNEKLFTLLVFGGSQGAQSINRALVDYLEICAENLDMQVLWACGSGHERDILDSLNQRLPDLLRERVILKDYIHDMPSALAAADLALCRAGAGTISEVALAGLAAILVPYPYAAEDHQLKNAVAIEQSGAAVVIRDQDLTGACLARTITGLRSASGRLAQMKAGMKSLARPRALDEIVDTLMEACPD